MSYTTFRRGSLRALGIVLLAFTLSPALTGCGGSSSGQPQNAGAPRFATADELLQHYNDLTCNVTQINAESVISLMYCESPKQEQMLRIYQTSMPLLRLDQACWDTYGAGFSKSSPDQPFAPNRAPYKFVENGPDRAKATGELASGTPDDVYLVRIGDRWWISGYTLEYDRQIDWDRIDLARMERAIGYYASAAPLVEEEVRSDSQNWKQHGANASRFVQLRTIAYITQNHPEVAQDPTLLEW